MQRKSCLKFRGKLQKRGAERLEEPETQHTFNLLTKNAFLKKWVPKFITAIPYRWQLIVSQQYQEILAGIIRKALP